LVRYTSVTGRLADRSDRRRRRGASLLVGFRVLWQLRPVAALTVITVADLFLSGMMEVLLPAFSKLALRQSATQYGLLVSIAGAACLAGTLILSPIAGRLGTGRGLALVLAARGLLLLPLMFAGLLRRGRSDRRDCVLPDGSFFSISRTVQQRLIPAEVRGRVLGARGALTAAGFPLGAAACGCWWRALVPSQRSPSWRPATCRSRSASCSRRS
jgi:hypothetical protein